MACVWRTTPSARPLLSRLALLRGQPVYLSITSHSRHASSSSKSNSSSSKSNQPPSIKIDGKSYKTDAWFNTPNNVLTAATRRLHLQKDHPVAITRQIIESSFPAPTFRYHHVRHPVVSTFQNFDSLGFPADHPGRQRSDTYYINEKTLLRTHTSAHELETFRQNASRGFLLSADVYRRDEVDRTHYPVFHQMEGARVWDRRTEGDKEDGSLDLTPAIRADLARLPQHNVQVEDPNPPFHQETNPMQMDRHKIGEVAAMAAHLKRSLELMVISIFERAAAAANPEALAVANREELKMRWVEAYFPFTAPSWELEVYWQGDWLEVLGCGISQQKILDDAGVSSQMAWAFGIGLDRIAMLLFQIPDIRLFWSQDRRFLDQFVGVSDDLSKLKRFVPFSKYPACPKDVSFWLPTSPTVHPNDVMEVIRSVAGDIVEDVRLADQFTHPKTKRESRLYHIVYRSLERTLTNVEVNKLHDDVCAALVGRLGVEIR